MRSAPLVLLLLLAGHGCALEREAVMQTPAMGFNNWYTPWSLGKPFTEQDITRVAQALVSTGLRERGYVYVNLDCGYSNGYRDKKTGQVVADSSRFPSGLKGLGDFIHSLSLRFGIYTSGQQCCGPKDRDDGILGKEAQDVAYFSAIGVDFLKNDGCGSTDSSFLATRDAIRNSTRPMIHSIHTSYTHDRTGFSPLEASSVVQANLWRTTGDIGIHGPGTWSSILNCARQNNAYAAVVNSNLGQQGFNNPDILQVGNGNLTDAEGRSHFSLWCLMKAPLLIGCDVSTATSQTLATLANIEAIAVNQDMLAVQGTLRHEVPGQHQIWAGELIDGCHAALVVSVGPASLTNIELSWSVLNASNITSTTPLRVRDLWGHVDRGVSTGAANVTIADVHGCAFLKLCPV